MKKVALTWPWLQHLKLTKKLSQDKDQDIELFIKDIERGAKPVSTVINKDEEGCINLAILKHLKIKRGCQKTLNSLLKPLKVVPSLLAL